MSCSITSTPVLKTDEKKRWKGTNFVISAPYNPGLASNIIFTSSPNISANFSFASTIFKSSFTMTIPWGSFFNNMLVLSWAILLIKETHISFSALPSIKAFANERQLSYPQPPQFNSSASFFLLTLKSACWISCCVYSLA